jgi:hypothetical protein
VTLLAARGWETLIGGGLGLAAALLLPIGGAAGGDIGRWWRIRRRDR